MPVLGPLVAYMQTPRNASGRIVEETYETLIENAISAGVDAVSVLGSVGGAAYMPRALRKKAIAKAVAVAAGRVPILAGVGALTTAEVGLNLSDAADAGASGALLQPMSYQPLLPHEVMFLYERANDLTKIPLWVYNNPATTRHVFSTEELASIAALKNVAGFKDRAANAPELKHRIEYIAANLPTAKTKQFNWGFSGETKGALVLGAGGHTWHSALAGVLPGLCVELAQAAVAGREDPEIAAFATQMQRALNPLTVTMTQYGGIRVAHAVAQQQGLNAGDLPQPLRPLPPAVHGIVQLALESIERSLRTLQDELAQGGIAAASNAQLDTDAPTLGEIDAKRTRSSRATSRRRATDPHAHAFGSHTDDHTAQGAPTAIFKHPNSSDSAPPTEPMAKRPGHSHQDQTTTSHSVRTRNYSAEPLESNEHPTEVISPVGLDQDTEAQHLVANSMERSDLTGTPSLPEGVNIVRKSVLPKKELTETPSGGSSQPREENSQHNDTPAYSLRVTSPSGAFGRLRSQMEAGEGDPFKTNADQQALSWTDSEEDLDSTLVLNLSELPTPEQHTLSGFGEAGEKAVPPLPPGYVSGGTQRNQEDGEAGHKAQGDQLDGSQRPAHVSGAADIPMTRSAARAAREALQSQRELELAATQSKAEKALIEDLGLDAFEGMTPEEIAQQLLATNAPTRVSAKARIQNEATRAELAHAAEHFLLSGDPEVDQTHINLERVEIPLIEKSARDSDNYVPRRARSSN